MKKKIHRKYCNLFIYGYKEVCCYIFHYIIFGLVSDVFGRRFTIIISYLISSVGIFMIPLCKTQDAYPGYLIPWFLITFNDEIKSIPFIPDLINE